MWGVEFTTFIVKKMDHGYVNKVAPHSLQSHFACRFGYFFGENYY